MFSTRIVNIDVQRCQNWRALVNIISNHTSLPHCRWGPILAGWWMPMFSASFTRDQAWPGSKCAVWGRQLIWLMRIIFIPTHCYSLSGSSHHIIRIITTTSVCICFTNIFKCSQFQERMSQLWAKHCSYLSPKRQHRLNYPKLSSVSRNFLLLLSSNTCHLKNLLGFYDISLFHNTILILDIY